MKTIYKLFLIFFHIQPQCVPRRFPDRVSFLRTFPLHSQWIPSVRFPLRYTVCSVWVPAGIYCEFPNAFSRPCSFILGNRACAISSWLPSCSAGVSWCFRCKFPYVFVIGATCTLSLLHKGSRRSPCKNPWAWIQHLWKGKACPLVNEASSGNPQMQMTSLLTIIPRTSLHSKLLFQSNTKNMKMTHTRAFTSRPFEFFCEFRHRIPPNTKAAHVRWLFFTPSWYIYSWPHPTPLPFSMCQTLQKLLTSSPGCSPLVMAGARIIFHLVIELRVT